jgi:hypothetical protein
MKFIKTTLEIIEELDEDKLPMYYILRTYSLFNFSLCGELIGQNGKDIPFYDLTEAENYLKLIK